MAVGYTTVANVQNYLGVTLTPAQQAQATALMDPAESVINLETRRTWNPSSVVVTNEQYDLLRDWLYLKNAPVVSIQSLVVRTREVGDPGVTLTQSLGGSAGDYELQDPALGLVVLNSGYGDPRIELGNEVGDGFPDQQEPILVVGEAYNIARTYALVSYTYSRPVDPTIAHAATLIVAHWLRLNLDPSRFELVSKTTGKRTVTYRTDDLPADAMHLLTLNKRGGIVG